jgi:hypothetical protein
MSVREGYNRHSSGYYVLDVPASYFAGSALTTGSHNIDIGHKGIPAETDTIRIGTQGIQSAAFVAGIYNHSLSGEAVVVSATGELGVVSSSSRRFKMAIESMESNTAKLAQLRPVMFRFKTDPLGMLLLHLLSTRWARAHRTAHRRFFPASLE